MKQDVEAQMNRLRGKRALVTGAERGIGAGIVQKLIAEGAKVCLNSLGDPSEVEAALEQHQSDGKESFVFRADVSIPNFLALEYHASDVPFFRPRLSSCAIHSRYGSLALRHPAAQMTLHQIGRVEASGEMNW